jgi:hypothetical protein
MESRCGKWSFAKRIENKEEQHEKESRVALFDLR